jgi:3,4-dihydroxy 2-butanone 4-phosphate synthase / GTP cyclohydrolase II
VLMRAGHTEAGCDLGMLTGLTPSSVICEIMKDDGEMARLPDLEIFAREHGLKIGAIADLIHYRSANESLIERVAERPINTVAGPMRMLAYRDKPSGTPHLALVCGQIDGNREALVRVHEPLSIVDLLDVDRTTHSWPIHRSLKAIAEHGHGVLVMLNCAPHAQELFESIGELMQVDAQQEARSTRVKRNASIDLRTYGIGAQILKDLQVRKMRLLSQPRKMPSMTGYDLEIVGFEPGL